MLTMVYTVLISELPSVWRNCLYRLPDVPDERVSEISLGLTAELYTRTLQEFAVTTA